MYAQGAILQPKLTPFSGQSRMLNIVDDPAGSARVRFDILLSFDIESWWLLWR